MNEEERTRTVTYLYISYIFTIFLFSVIYPLRKREDCKEDEVLSSHIRGQIRTTVYAATLYTFSYFVLSDLFTSFNFSPQRLLWAGVLFLLIPSLMIWIFYRVIKGISKLADNAYIPDERSEHRKNLSMCEAKRSNTVVLLFISYALMLIFSLFSFIYLLIKRNDCKQDEVLSTHISWQLKTIIFSFIASICLVIFCMIIDNVDLIEILLLLPAIWVIYRVTKGINKLSNNKPI